jgi:hypothetical protein
MLMESFGMTGKCEVGKCVAWRIPCYPQIAVKTDWSAGAAIVTADEFSKMCAEILAQEKTNDENQNN